MKPSSLAFSSHTQVVARTRTEHPVKQECRLISRLLSMVFAVYTTECATFEPLLDGKKETHRKMISNRPECGRADLDLISATARCSRSCRKWKRVPALRCSVRLVGKSVELRRTRRRSRQREKRQAESRGNTIRMSHGHCGGILDRYLIVRSWSKCLLTLER